MQGEREHHSLMNIRACGRARRYDFIPKQTTAFITELSAGFISQLSTSDFFWIVRWFHSRTVHRFHFHRSIDFHKTVRRFVFRPVHDTFLNCPQISFHNALEYCAQTSTKFFERDAHLMLWARAVVHNVMQCETGEQSVSSWGYLDLHRLLWITVQNHEWL